MSVKLVVEKSEGQSGHHEVSITTAETVVGRHRECGLRIPCAEVSRRHGILRLQDGTLSIEDLGSLNGIYVNGERVAGTQPLQPGDRLEIGPVLFCVVYENMAVAAGVAATTTELTAAAESATVDMKRSDTGIIENTPKPEVVTVERVIETGERVRADAFTRLER